MRCSMANQDFSIFLRNYAGVPVVELVGEIDKKTVAMLQDILGKLVQAGHYNVMLNLKRAAWGKASALESLKKMAKMFQMHYGNVDIVADMNQITNLRNLSCFRFCTSEGQALERIRRLPSKSMDRVKAMSAHLADST